jgi:hypothetical protein
MNDFQKQTIDKYLDQVKVLTALATTFLITPNLLLTILGNEKIKQGLDSSLSSWRLILSLTNIAFVLAILSTYFIYSSIVGMLAESEANIYRPATRFFSLLQFLFLILGCIGLVVILAKIL